MANPLAKLFLGRWGHVLTGNWMLCHVIQWVNWLWQYCHTFSINPVTPVTGDSLNKCCYSLCAGVTWRLVGFLSCHLITWNRFSTDHLYFKHWIFVSSGKRTSLTKFIMRKIYYTSQYKSIHKTSLSWHHSRRHHQQLHWKM